jgi:sec-independent protein translocase protein TatA
MFGSIGLQEMVVIMALALLVFGPKKLPEIGRTLGKALREFKKSTEEIKDKFEEQIRVDEFKDLQNDIKKGLGADELKDLQNDIKKGLDTDEEGQKKP